jgi:hypothetical protein
MRFALAVLFVAATAIPVGAQDKQQDNPKSAADVRRDDAKKQYSAVHFKKRRVFVKNCIEQARSLRGNGA